MLKDQLMNYNLPQVKDTDSKPMQVVRDRLLMAETGKNASNNRSQIRVTLVSQVENQGYQGKPVPVPKNYYQNYRASMLREAIEKAREEEKSMIEA